MGSLLITVYLIFISSYIAFVNFVFIFYFFASVMIFNFMCQLG